MKKPKRKAQPIKPNSITTAVAKRRRHDAMVKLVLLELRSRDLHRELAEISAACRHKYVKGMCIGCLNVANELSRSRK